MENGINICVSSKQSSTNLNDTLIVHNLIHTLNVELHDLTVYITNITYVCIQVAVLKDLHSHV